MKPALFFPRHLLMAVLYFGLMVLPGAVVPAHAEVSALKDHDVKMPVDISADKLEVRQKENIAVFAGNVMVTQGDMTMTSDRITVFYEPQENGELSSAITRLDSSGNVVLKSPTEEITSTWGVYDLSERIITLGGKVVLKREDGVLQGKRLQLNIDTGTISIEGAVTGETGENRVKGQFTIPDKK
ncbi:LptA/OstA family protein [Luteithermobacter gelatinilyticus]|uniref:LptA/OstA family protein n=1 Tax=Luteithermobacter gelatinilyticus TaxID=2582913 RepID=UPI001105C607|nr:LptA/OstA family protein [Luteithermobacter gelatinilyticus]